MDFPENESVASFTTNWSDDVDLHDPSVWESECEPVAPELELLYDLLRQDLEENRGYTFEQWQSDWEAGSFRTNVRSLRWMEEFSQACTETLKLKMISQIQDWFMDLRL